MLRTGFSQLFWVLALFFIFLVPFRTNAQEGYRMEKVEFSDSTRLLFETPWSSLADRSSSKTLNALLRNIGPKDWSYEGFSVPQAKVVQLTAQGPECLVAAIDTGGQMRVALLLLLCRDNGGITGHWFDTYFSGVGAIRDLDGDNRMEVHTDNLVVFNASRDNAIPWPKIFKWNGQMFSEASKDFPSFYKEFLGRVNGHISKIEPMSVDDIMKENLWDRELASEYRDNTLGDWKTIHYLAKQVLGEKRAGYDQAIEWASNPRAGLRRNATVIFHYIGDDESRDQLQRLSRDKNESVAQSAKWRLDELKQKSEHKAEQ